MDLDRGGVKREGFNLDPHDLLGLQLLEDSVQYAVLGPAIHACINAVPFAEPGRKAAPFTALFGNKQNRIEHFEVLKFYVPALNWQAILDSFVLLPSYLH